MIDEFNKGIDMKIGRKYTKITTNGSVWGFIANEDGVHKGIPHKKGDVFKGLDGELQQSGLGVLFFLTTSSIDGLVLTI